MSLPFFKSTARYFRALNYSGLGSERQGFSTYYYGLKSIRIQHELPEADTFGSNFAGFCLKVLSCIFSGMSCD